jgi:hypothetical protein
MRRITIAALVCCSALSAAPAAMAQGELDPLGAAETVVGSLRGGITDHEFACEESRPEVQRVVQGVKHSLKVIYPNITTLIARGYFPYADAPLLGLSGRQGHWINPGYLEDGRLMDPDRPESILVDRWNRPIGVMFIADDPHEPGPDLYVAEDGTPCNAWHYHSEITADAYWYAYKYAYSGDTQEGDLQPPDRTPDLMHVWAYGADGIAPDTGENLFKYQWTHAVPPQKYMPGDPKEVGDYTSIVGGYRAPGQPPTP